MKKPEYGKSRMERKKQQQPKKMKQVSGLGKRVLVAFMVLLMCLSLLPTTAFAADDKTETVFGLTVKGPQDGFTTHKNDPSTPGAIMITQPGTYTISGTYADESYTGASGPYTCEEQWATGQGTSHIWRGIINTMKATGDVKLIFNNVTIQTTKALNMPVILSRGSDGESYGKANVTIELRGTNTLSAPADQHGGAIVKQGGSGSLTFTGSGILNASAKGVAIGSPFWLNTSTTIQAYDCNNIIFNHTGTITATTSSEYSPAVGAAAGLMGGTDRASSVSNIQVKSGKLNLENIASEIKFYGALLGASSWSSNIGGIYDNIAITGGIINASTPKDDTPGISAVGGRSPQHPDSISITGGTLDVRDGLKPVSHYLYGAYIGTSANVESLSVKMNGLNYTYHTTDITNSTDGNTWLYLPTGNAAVTLNGTTYYGTVDASDSTVLKSEEDFVAVTNITGLQSTMAANTTITLNGKVLPENATFQRVSKYEVLNAESSHASIAGVKLTAPAEGEVQLRATINSGAGSSDYTQDFTVTVNHTAVTDISGIPTTIQNGETVTLSPRITPTTASYRDITWSVTNGAATIERNRLTPNTTGSIGLTATVANGSAYGSAYTKTFTIAVPFVQVKDIEADIPAMLETGKPLSLTGSVSPTDASYHDITWSVNGNTGATIQDGVLTATTAGNLELTATVKNGLAEEQDYTETYFITVFAQEGEISVEDGNITIVSKDTNTNRVTYGGGQTKDVLKTEALIIKGTTTTNQIIVNGTSANILFVEVNMNQATDKSCIDLQSGASLTLAAQGACTLSNNSKKSYLNAAIHVPTGTTLTLQNGGGSLKANSGYGAGIGGKGNNGDGNKGEDAGTIKIEGGTVITYAYEGAGIGGGGGYGTTGGKGGTITISGGTVSASSSTGAGIGGGSALSTAGEGGTITISGGTVSASSSTGAGIGGGYGTTGGAGGTITISGGTVSASSSTGAGIGGGVGDSTGGEGGFITITGGTVIAKGCLGAAIGGGYGRTEGEGIGGEGGFITITGGTVSLTADSSVGSMAVGAGLNVSNTLPASGNGTLTITGGSIYSNVSLSGGKSGSNTCISATNGSTKVYCTTAYLTDIAGKNTALTGTSSIDGAEYGFNDVSTDANGKIYFYLPENTSRTATLGGTEDFTGSTKTDGTGVLTKTNLLASLTLDTPYLTDTGATVSATPTLAGTVYYLIVKGGEAGRYANAAALKSASGANHITVTANTPVILTGMPASEGDYTIYAALISTSGTYQSAVAEATLQITPTAPEETDVSIDYANETLKAATGLGYKLKYFNNENFDTDGIEITTSGTSITDSIGTNIYIRKAYTDDSLGSVSMVLDIPARPEAPATPSTTTTANTITVTSAVSGEEYRIDSGNWQDSGSFSGLTAVKEYTISTRTKATESAFSSELASVTASTVATVETPTKTGNGANFAGNTITANRTTVGVGQTVTYTVTSIAGYTPTLTVNNNTVTLMGTASPYTYVYTPSEGTATITAEVSFDGKEIANITHDSITLFADDAKNASQSELESYLATTSVMANDSSNNSLGTLTANYSTTSTWSATGGTYTYTATASNNKTCDFTVTVKPISANITAVDPISLMVKPTEGYSTHVDIGLPNSLTVTYTGTDYTQHTENLNVSWSAVPADFGKTPTGTNSPVAFTGTVTLPAWATGANSITANVTITPKNKATVTFTQGDITYPNQLGDPSITVTDKDGNTLTDTNKLKVLYKGTLASGVEYASTPDKPTMPGTYIITVTYEDDTNHGTGNATFKINKAASDPNLDADDSNDDNENNYTYGDTIILTVTPKEESEIMTMSEEGDTEGIENQIMTMSDPEPPTVNTVDFYYENADGEYKNLNETSVTVDDTGKATFSYDTKLKTLPIGESTIVASYGGSDVLASAFDSMTVTINPKQLTGTVSGASSKTYDGNADFSNVEVTLSGVVAGDTVGTTATASLTANSKDVGTDIGINNAAITLSGEHKDWYTAPDTLTGTVTIEKAAISVASASVAGKEYDGNTTTSATVTFDGLVDGESLTAGTDYTISAVFQSKDVSENVTADVTVTLEDTAIANNYHFASEDVKKTTGTASITAKAISGTVKIVLDTDNGETGIADTNDTLKATGYQPDNATVTYQWMVAGNNAGTGTNYTVKAGDKGKLLTVTVTGTGNYSGTLSAASYKIGARELTGTVAIEGTTNVGDALTAALTSTREPVMGTDYRVQWYRMSGDKATSIAGANALTYTLTNADLGKTLRVDFIADKAGSVFSGTLSQTVAIPAVKPTAPVLAATAGSGKITITWPAPFDGGSALTGYYLYVKTGTGDYGSPVNISANATSYDVTGLTNGTSYTFKLAAVNTKGETVSTEVSATPVASSSGSGSSSGSSSSGSSSNNSTTDTTPTQTTTPAETTQPAQTPSVTPAPAKPVVTPVKPTGTEAPFIAGKNGEQGWEAITSDITDTFTKALEDADVDISAVTDHTGKVDLEKLAANPEVLDALSGLAEPLVVTVDMNGATELPADIVSLIAGKNVDLTLDMGDGISWTINGNSVTGKNFSDINLDVTKNADKIPVDIVNQVSGENYSMQIELSHNGEFGFTATLNINLEKENAGYYANLFYFNEETDKLEFMGTSLINEEGEAALEFVHASAYTIVVSAEPMSAETVTDAAGDSQDSADLENTETTVEAVEDTNGSMRILWVILGIAVVIAIGSGVYLLMRKKESEE